jgi:hypothetical protein
MRPDREPHIGEYDAKTNAICGLSQILAACELGRERAQKAITECERALLPVALEHLIACRGQLGPVFLKTGQNDEIALVHQGATETLNIARTSLLLLGRAAALWLLLLGDSPGGHRQ